MRPFVFWCKQNLVRIATSILFYSKALALIQGFVSRFQPRQNERGDIVFPFIKKRQHRSVQIFGYHRVNDSPDPFFPPVPTQVFARHMEYVASGCTPLALEEAVERIKHDDVPDNAVVVTFDDGYRDNLLNAFPILRQLSIPATIFLATEAIGSGKILWHDKVFSAFRETTAPFLEDLADPTKKYSLTTLEEKLFAQGVVLKFLRSVSEHERTVWITRLTEKLQVEEKQEAGDLMLSWEESKMMHRYGVAFGSHTVTHPILSNLSPQEVMVEVNRSKQVIEEKLGAPVRAFAYPRGKREDFNELTKHILKEAGYLCALSTIFGTNTVGQDLFELRRGSPWEKDLPTFATKLEWYKFIS